MRQPIFVKTPQENLIALINFHSGDEKERREVLWSLAREIDVIKTGETIEMKKFDVTETTFSKIPISLQTILKEDFALEINDNIFVVMRFFSEELDGSFIPVKFDEVLDEDSNE